MREDIALLMSGLVLVGAFSTVSAQQRSTPVTVINSADSNPVPVTVQSGVFWQAVGISNSDVKGDGDGRGIVAMNQLCQATFGNTARMCTTEQWITSKVGLGPIDTSSWIQPVIVAKEGELVDVTGFVGATNCATWSSSRNVNRGMVVSNVFTGVPRLQTLNCDRSLPVTCCVLRKIDEGFGQ